jgi:hypothetical protein
MSGHQDIAEDLDREPAESTAEQVHKVLIVPVLDEYAPAIIPSVRHMSRDSDRQETRAARHDHNLRTG